MQLAVVNRSSRALDVNVHVLDNSDDVEHDTAPLAHRSARRLHILMPRVDMPMERVAPLREFDPNSTTFDRSLLSMTPQQALALRRRESVLAALRAALTVRWSAIDGARSDTALRRCGIVDMGALNVSRSTVRALCSRPVSLEIEMAESVKRHEFTSVVVSVRAGTDGTPALSLTMAAAVDLENGLCWAQSLDNVVWNGQHNGISVPQLKANETFTHTAQVRFDGGDGTCYRLKALAAGVPFETFIITSNQEEANVEKPNEQSEAWAEATKLIRCC